jgi:hypothetical protein
MKQQDNDSLLLAKLHEWDPDWGEKYRRMSTNPWSNGVLPVKLIELICLALNSACTNRLVQGLPASGRARSRRDGWSVRRRNACARERLVCSYCGSREIDIVVTGTPFCDEMRAIGQWNTAWDPFFELDPVWTDQFFASAVGIYQSGVLSPKESARLCRAYRLARPNMPVHQVVV